MAELSNAIVDDNPRFDALCNRIFHTGGAEQKDRFLSLLAAHRECFNASAKEFYSSPGRIEITGNHTDHNGVKLL